MKKVVALLSPESDFVTLDRELTGRDIADSRVIKVADDYEEQIRQEIFLMSREGRTIILGAAIGALAGLLLFAWLLGNHSLGQVLSPLLANTIYSSLFTGAGTGLAAGALFSGLYALSRPLQGNFAGHMMLVIYCEPERRREAVNLLRQYRATLL